MKNISRFLVASILSVAVALLAGCQTIDGMGKDVSAGGKAISKASRY